MKQATNNPARPILRYHGGKWLLAPWIISNFPAHRIYVEPFGGAASVLLRKPRSYAEVYNDLSGEVVNLFRMCRDRGGELRDSLAATPFARDEYAESFERSSDPLEQARRTVIRSYMGFGSNAIRRDIKSGFRANSNRSGTTPAHDWNNYPAAMDGLIERLGGVVIENRPALDVSRAHDGPKTLHYWDPPYPHSTRACPGKGYDYELSDEEHRELAGEARKLKGMVIVSGYDCPLYDELYEGWQTVRRDALADGARERVEVLWISPNTHKAAPLFADQYNSP